MDDESRPGAYVDTWAAAAEVAVTLLRSLRDEDRSRHALGRRVLDAIAITP
jgi:hypothetical protein